MSLAAIQAFFRGISRLVFGMSIPHNIRFTWDMRWGIFDTLVESELQAMQVFWPDKEEKFPYELGCDLDVFRYHPYLIWR